MDIPSPYIEILTKNMERVKTTNDVKQFVEKCFEDLFIEFKDLGFQARAKKSGDMFEYIFYIVIRKLFNIDLVASYPIPKACMEGGGSLDFGLLKKGKLVCGIEAKGSAERVGETELTRPALKRTDTVKKAISQAYQFKRALPRTPFYIVTNVKPVSGNARCMTDLAEGDIVDKIIDITNPEDLEWFADRLRELIR